MTLRNYRPIKKWYNLMVINLKWVEKVSIEWEMSMTESNL